MSLSEQRMTDEVGGAALLDEREAARYCGVSPSFFRRNVRELLGAEYDVRAPGSDKAMPRWARPDLDAWIQTRRKERKTA